MKKKLLFLLLMAFASMSESWALYFSVTVSSGQTLNFKTNGGAVDVEQSSGVSGALIIPATVTYNGDTYYVESISSRAFYNCTGLTSVIVPEFVTAIFSNAFENCTSLTSISLPSGLRHISTEVFKNCSSLSSIDFPSALKSISDRAFQNCVSLTSITIPDSITFFSQNTFSGCTNIATVYFNAVCANGIGSGSQGGWPNITNVYFGPNVQKIPSYAFEGCSSLTSINLPSSVMEIGINAFKDCASLTNVSISSSQVQIKESAFDGCTSLESIDLSSVISIGKTAFRLCASLTSITFGDDLTSIDMGTFANCTSLDVVIPNNVTSIGSNAFLNVHSIRYCGSASGSPWGAQAAYACYTEDGLTYLDSTKTVLTDCATNLTTVTIPNSVVKIESYAFKQCSTLTSLTIPSSVKYIGSNAFFSCRNLTHITLPDSIADIKAYSFRNCYRLQTVNLPSSLKNIERGAFQGCRELSTILFPNTLETIGADAFDGTSSLRTVTLPVSLKQIGGRAFCNSGLHTLYVDASEVYADNSQIWLWCDSLCEIYIGESVRRIPDSFFAGLSSVNTFTHLELPVSVRYIGSGAFSNCTQLVEITIPENVDTMGVNVFDGCIALKKIHYNAHHAVSVNELDFPIQTIRNYTCGMLSYCNVMTNRTTVMLNEHLPAYDTLFIGNDVETIPDGAFGVVYNRKRYDLDSSMYFADTKIINNSTRLRHIGIAAFTNMRIHEFDFGDSLKSIGTGAFMDTKIEKVTLPEGMEIVGDAAFKNCPSLDSIILPTSIQILGMECFSDLNSLRYLYYDCENAITPNYTFGEIKEGTTPFDVTPNLTTITFGPNVRHLNAGVFTNTDGLQRIIIPEGVESIADKCFSVYHRNGQPFYSGYYPNVVNESFLRYVSLPSTLTYIGQNAFPDDYLDTIVCRGSIPASLNECFGNNTKESGVLMIPCGSSARYNSANEWSEFNNVVSVMPYDIVLTVNNDTMGTVVSLCTNTQSNNLQGVRLTATPTDHHHFVQWSDGVTTNPRTIYLDGDTAFQAQFAWGNLYQITARSANNSRGSATGSGTFVENSVDTLTATANYGYHFDHWNDGDTTNPRLLTVTASGTYTATFMPNQYTLAASSEDSAHGTVSGSGAYNFNTSHTITATPTTGYHFTQWNDGNTSNPRSIMITRDTAFVASFAINIYSLTVASADATMGGASADTSHYEHGDTATLLATPQYGYHFDHWNDGNTDNPRLVVMTQNKSLTAVFAANTYIVATQSDSLQGSVAGGGTYDYLYNVQLTATANYGYHFSSWSDGNTDNPRTLQVTQDTTLEALFLPNSYTLTLASNDPAHGNTQGGGTYLYLDTVQISVSGIAPHYHFSSWSDGSTDSVRNIVIVSDSSITANFAIDQHELTVLTADDEFGSVSGSGMFDYGTSATIQATPAAGYYFVGWSNGEIANPATVDVMCDTMVTATFAPELEANLYMVSVENGRNTLLWRAEPTAVTYNILRESSVAGVYETVATLQAEETMSWVDTASRPESRSYRYRLEAADQWNTVFTGPVHKTMHLTINRGVGSNRNLVWTEYEGTQFNTYIIYRGMSPSDMAEIDRLPVGGNTTYTDANAPSGDLYYQVGIVPAQPMFSLGKAYDVILSNIAESAAVGIASAQASGIAVAGSHEGICIVGTPGMEVEVYSVDGRLVDKRVSSADRSTIVVPSGVYLVRVNNLPPQKVVVLR